MKGTLLAQVFPFTGASVPKDHLMPFDSASLRLEFKIQMQKFKRYLILAGR